MLNDFKLLTDSTCHKGPCCTNYFLSY